MVFGSSRLLSTLLYSIPPVNDSAHEEDAIASPFLILETQKYHNKLLSVCSVFFIENLSEIVAKNPCLSVHQVSSLYKAAMLAIITSGRHLFWPGHPPFIRDLLV